MNTFVISLIVALGTILSPLLLSYLTSRQRRADKEQDWQREDLVAERLRVASEALLTSQAVLATKADEAKELLNQIHTNGNSTLTASMEATLEATKAQFVMMEAAQNGENTPVVQAAIEALKIKIASMEKTLAERAVQTEIADAQADAPTT